MADQHNTSDNTKTVPMDKSLILLMTILDVKHPGLDADKWADKWPEVAAARGMSESDARQLFDEIKEEFSVHTKNFVRKPVVIKRRKRASKAKAQPPKAVK
ncbi:hypothetical protein PG991_010816 [Apiospora marii]|uniref:Uncharacterized protein n=1 Tax=Apiospora marii TaxID=335849 RepID=A0ABR1RCN3_9PEZI